MYGKISLITAKIALILGLALCQEPTRKVEGLEMFNFAE
jgi:hypothetical protein